jgi:hypothetical protein
MLLDPSTKLSAALEQQLTSSRRILNSPIGSLPTPNVEAADGGIDQAELVRFDTPDQWAEGRHGSIDTSDGATILGEGYSDATVYSLWDEKCHGTKPEFTASTLKKLEKIELAAPYVAGLCELDFGWKIQFDPHLSFRRNRKRRYLTCSLDAWLLENEECCPLEFQNINAYSFKREWGEDGGSAPLRYTIRLQHQLAVTGWKKGYLVVFSGMDLTKIEVHRNDRLIESMLAEYDNFWRHVRDKREPGIDNATLTRVAIKSFGEALGHEPTIADLTEANVRAWLMALSEAQTPDIHALKNALLWGWEWLARTGRVPVLKLDSETAQALLAIRQCMLELGVALVPAPAVEGL